ncbi:MAG: TIGR03546 family protein [Thermodesulfobacteriota bacterium]|nr:TIGR03546 family protein [Thermodesulfobacteriota bacterium]
MLTAIAKVLKILNSESRPGQISMALCFSMVIGFTPLLSLHNLVVLLVILVFRVNLSAFILGIALFKGGGYLLNPLFHWIGLSILTAKPMEGLWTTLYNSTLWRIERFNNSVLMGSLLFSLILFVPLYLILNLMIRQYRERVLQWVRKTGIMKAFMASKLYRAYHSLSQWEGTT